MSMECWKDIPGYEGWYEISTQGNVRVKASHKEVLQSKNTAYKTVNLTKQGTTKIFSVHRLVAKTFIPKDQEGINIVNHIDGDKHNNKISNLEWVDSKANTAHAYANGLIKHDKKIKDDSWKEKLQAICDYDKRSKSCELEWLIEQRYLEISVKVEGCKDNG